MRTPIKYGKRKRPSNINDRQWDAAIDISPGSITPSRTTSVVIDSPGATPIAESERPSPLKQSASRKVVDIDLDVFDFERDTKERRARQKAQDTSEKNEVSSATKLHDHRDGRGKSLSAERPKARVAFTDMTPSTAKAKAEAEARENITKAKEVIGKQSDESNPVPEIRQSSTQVSPLRRSPRNLSTIANPEDRSLHHQILDFKSTKAAKETKYAPSPTKKSLPAITAPAKPGKRATSMSYTEHQDEVDLEPIIRTITPLPYHISKPLDKSPQVSPEQRRVFDIFDASHTAARTNFGAGKLLASLTKSKSSTKPKDTNLMPDKDPLPLGKLLEDAENELVEFSQPILVLENESSPFDGRPVPEQSQSATQLSSLSQPNKVTYGRQRSFLAEPITNDIDQIGRYSPVVSNDGTDDDGEELSSNNVVIKNLHDLRQGGENQRFVDDVLYLLEGLDSPSSVQGTLLELAIKLLSRDFARKFHAAGFESRVESACKNMDDPITMFAVSVIISAMLQQSGKDGPAPLTKVQERILGRSLRYNRPILAYLNDKSVKTSKFNKIATKELAAAIEKTEAFQNLSQGYDLSPRLLSLMCFFLQTNLQQKAILKLVLPVLEDFAVYRIGNLVEKQMIISFLEMLEADTLLLLTTKHFVQLRDTANNLLNHDDEQFPEQATTILSGTLRILISIVNQSVAAVPVIATADFVSSLLRHAYSHGASVSENADDIVLCLGLLVSLAEESDLTKTTIVESCTPNFLLPAAQVNKVVSKHNLVEALRNRLAAVRRRSSCVNQILMKKEKNDMMTGYLALLLYHVLYDGGSRDESTDDLQTKARSVVKHGLEILRDATAEVPELQNRLAQHLSGL